MTNTSDVDPAPVERLVMPSWDQLIFAYAQLGQEDRMRVLIRSDICPKPILKLTWGIELTLIKHNGSKWPKLLDEIRWQRRRQRNKLNAQLG